MFTGEFIALFIYAIIYLHKLSHVPKLSASEKKAYLSHSTAYSPFLFAIPAFMDCIANTLNKIGLILIDASVWQMMRAS